MSEEFKVSAAAYVPGLVELLESVGGSIEGFPHLLAALDDSANLMHEAWIGFASGTPIPGGLRVINSRGEYKASIKVDLTNPTEKVVYSDSKIHKYLEDGSDAVDLKEGLLSGPKVKFGKNGPYNIVAFRHGTPGTVESNKPMPVHIFQLTQTASKGFFKNKGAEANSKEVIGKENTDGIRSKLVKNFEPKLGNYTWKSGKYAGMQRIETSTGKAKSSNYITFRVVSSKSDPSSWIRPPQAPIPIRQAVIDTTRDLIEELLRTAIQADLATPAEEKTT